MANYNFNSTATSGEASQSNFSFDYLYDYLKTTAPREASESEWDIRQLVWSFKNDSDRTRRYTHSQALNRIIPAYERKLRGNYGSSVSNMTLVCIPASSRVKNERRWKEFSELVCDDLDMYNGYDHITVTGDAVAKHMGGSGVTSLAFDESFFRGKKVVICDDVRTTGRSIQQMRSKLESLGATVVGSITIAKTVHE